MNPFRAMLGGPAPERKTVDATELMRSNLSLPVSKSGITVDVDTALRVSTVLGCVRVISEDISKVPWKLFEEQDGGRKRTLVRRHPAARALLRRPNDWQTPQEFKQTLSMHAALTGAGRAYKSVSERTGELLELIPLVPGSTTAKQDPKTRELTYEVRTPGGEQMKLRREQVLEVRGLTWNGWQALDVIRLAQEAVGLAVGIERGQAALHANGGRPGGIISMEGEVKADGLRKIKEMWDATQKGVERWGGTAVFDRSAKYASLAMTNVDAQTLESRRLQIEEICRIFRVYPQKVMFADKTATFAASEQYSILHVLDTLQPWAVRWEQVLERDLLTDDEWEKGLFIRVMLQGLLRGDSKARAEFYKAGINDGWLTRNEVRGLEELDALEGLDVPLIPLNMGDGSKPPAGDPAKAPARMPSPTPPDDPDAPAAAA